MKGYPDVPRTLGEHLRKRRLDLGETQEQTASRFGVTVTSYNGWEADRIAPKIFQWPGVIRFLGYDPTPAPTNFDEALTSLQRRHGLPREELAVHLGIERKTLFNWLAGKAVPGPRALKRVLASRLAGAGSLCAFMKAKRSRDLEPRTLFAVMANKAKEN